MPLIHVGGGICLLNLGELGGELGSEFWRICRVEPGYFWACDSLIRECGGKLDVLSMVVHKDDDEDGEGEETRSDGYRTGNFKNTEIAPSKKETTAPTSSGKRCLTCNVVIGDAQEFREHYKSDWHEHNLKRKVRQLPPLSAEECLDSSVADQGNDMNEYSR
ncbi:ankyrin repeat and zinc finger domain-containing protein 1-like [Selaginella moellendorffii]|uniref:ankyrin repeat and zinc finger domain-containing protein 1-like n=1 Tax=Selaginella moellendorffii TaxID=88036 RepID=UPI000D1C5E0E|nr:ankyrin repeat and zinc finger domain-containing protein 1-like [Selaginella moellendorffii]|eukprot:XP_024539369.1 ankyrin repeat and zinc finger domain-containing protein 1-like [Selaginella moellendorffii]